MEHARRHRYSVEESGRSEAKEAEKAFTAMALLADSLVAVAERRRSLPFIPLPASFLHRGKAEYSDRAVSVPAEHLAVPTVLLSESRRSRAVEVHIVSTGRSYILAYYYNGVFVMVPVSRIDYSHAAVYVYPPKNLQSYLFYRMNRKVVEAAASEAMALVPEGRLADVENRIKAFKLAADEAEEYAEEANISSVTKQTTVKVEFIGKGEEAVGVKKIYVPIGGRAVSYTSAYAKVKDPISGDQLYISSSSAKLFNLVAALGRRDLLKEAYWASWISGRAAAEFLLIKTDEL